MLTLKSAKKEDDHKFSATYELVHVTPGRQGTHLTLDVKLTRAFGEVTAEIPDLVPKVKGESFEPALDKLAEWLERAAAAIRARGEGTPLLMEYKA